MPAEWTSKNHDICLIFKWDDEQPNNNIIDYLKISKDLRNPDTLLGQIKWEGCDFNFNDKIETVVYYLL